MAQERVDNVTNLEDASFARLAAEKEQEWRLLQAMHAQSLEDRIQEKDKILKEQQEKFQTLKEDFKFNLKLLAERDQELDRLEVTQEQLRARLQSREAGVSQLKIQIDELKIRRAQDERSMEDLQRHYQQRVREKQAEVEQYKISKDVELQTERDELEALRRDMKRRIGEVEEDLEIQRREMSAGFDDASRRREKEYRTKIDELSSTVLAHEMKAKLLSRELDLVRGASQQTSTELKTSDTKMDGLKKKLKQTEWELSDLRGMKDARIAELESQLLHAQQAVERSEEEFNRKHKELDRYAREKETAVVGLKESQVEAERKLHEEIRRLEGALEAREVESRREAWEHQDALKDKGMLVERHQQESRELRNQLDGQVSKVSKDLVSKDLVIESLRDRDGKLRAELECRKDDIERYQKELVVAAEKEQNMERTKAQLELDWQRRYEDAERNQYAKSEDLIARLTKSRDEAVALTRELERELQQRDDLNRVLARDRDQAVATLRKHKLKIDRDMIPSRDTGMEDTHLESRQAEELQAQNESLIAVIRDMKREMEEMESHVDRMKKDGLNPYERGDGSIIPRGPRGESTKDEQHAPFTGEYVKSIEKECRELKVEKRRLEERLSTLAQTIQGGEVYPSGHQGGIQINLAETDAIKSHIQSLNDTIGALRADKVTTSAELRKYQARLSHLETEMNQKQYQPREKQAEVDQLRYELSTQARRHAAESASYTQRMSQLELELMEARREADEYYKGTLQTNLEATTLGQQVSALTMDLAGRGTTSRHGIQSALVTQLQREVHNLRAQLARVRSQPGDDENTDINGLQAKLKTAAHHISRLAKEKQKLMEMGNRLRSELALYRPSPAPQPSRGQRSAVGERSMTAGKLAEQVSSKLQNLEKLQYVLTKQELQFARGRGHNEGVADVVQVQLSSSSDSTPEITPRIAAHAEDTQPLQSNHSQGNPPPQILRHSHSSEGEAPSSDSSASQRHTPLMMSSLGEESMQDVWRLLDDGASPLFFRSPSPMRKPDHSPIPEEPHPSIPSSSHARQHHSTGGLEVAGHSTHYKVRGSKPSTKSELSAMAAGRVQPQLQPPKRKVRNYVHRDGDVR
ncbi:coiled-coil domain-containing protein 57 [Strongylocentrotus purpuratus]|uniref:Coiled-coil domain-containing protein 57 n=1 Tax=Strongylocentrotus purpuratus TaxID=7668 RepID=A0A7M7RBU6_STRPU|nr:coiled-coil domain-containing protein 57 [Strongylocentrotus purpuratus]